MLSHDLSYQISNQCVKIVINLFGFKEAIQFSPISYTSCVCTYLSNLYVTLNLSRGVVASSRSSAIKLGAIDNK